MPMSKQEIERTLRSLRLSGIRQTLDARLLQASQSRLPFIEVFSLLLQDELDRRRTTTVERRFKLSGLDERLTLDDFDWRFNPKLPKNACFELLTLTFITDGQDAILIGPAGTGKSHIAKAVAHAAILEGFKVFCRDAGELLTDFFFKTQTGQKKKFLKEIVEADLVVFDDLFLQRKLQGEAADNFQEIIMARYKAKRSTMITSNRIFDDWGRYLGDNAQAAAIIDRLLHRGKLLKFEGKSYRLKEAAFRLAKPDTAE